MVRGSMLCTLWSIQFHKNCKIQKLQYRTRPVILEVQASKEAVKLEIKEILKVNSGEVVHFSLKVGFCRCKWWSNLEAFCW